LLTNSKCCTKYFLSFQNVNNFVEYFFIFNIHNEGETPEGGYMEHSKAKEGKSSENASESLPPQQPRKKKKTEDQRLGKAFELLTACSNQTMNDECQQFGNMIAAKLRNYNEMARCVIQSEIMNVFLNASSGLYERYHHTYLKPTSQVAPIPHRILLRHQSVSQYNNSILPYSFPTESISPATCSE